MVADDVEEPARRTATATEEIRHKIEEMQKSASEAVGAINEVVTIIAEVDKWNKRRFPTSDKEG